MASAHPGFKATPRELRTHDRHRVRLWAQVRQSERFDGDVVVRDLSESGFRFETPGVIESGAPVTLWIAENHPIEAIVVNRGEGSYGCEFKEPLSAELFGSLLSNGPFASAKPLRSAAVPEPSIKRFPGAVRVGIILGGATAGWAAIAMAALSIRSAL